jgi:L-lactate dehydrogenase
MSVKDQLAKEITESQVPKSGNKVSVIGAGAVGMACTFSILAKGVSNDVAMVDIMEKQLRGEMLDLQHGSIFMNNAKINASSDLAVTAGSKLIVITAGVRQKEGESRLNLVQRNVEVFKGLVPKLVQYSPDALFMVISNPCDILTYVTWKLSGLPKNRVFGSGTNLDSARFRYFLAEKLNVAPTSVDGWIIGEHGDSSVPVWSGVNVAGVRLRDINPTIGVEDDPEKWNELHKGVVDAAYEVIKLKGFTNWAIGLSCADLAQAFFSNTNEVKAVGTLVRGFHGIEKDVFLSLPCVINSNGVVSVVKQKLSDDEIKKLQASAEILDEIQKGIAF